MAALARRAGFDVDVARFEDWDPDGRRFDAVVSGQTWHWIDPVAGAAKAAEVLRPGGRLALFWNVMDPAPEIARAFAEVYVRVGPDLPFAPWSSATLDAYSPIFDAAAGGLAEAGAFDEPERWRFPWERVYTRDEWLEQVPTHGGHNRLPAQIQAALLDGIAEVVDAAGGRFTMRYVAVALVAGRRI